MCVAYNMWSDYPTALATDVRPRVSTTSPPPPPPPPTPTSDLPPQSLKLTWSRAFLRLMAELPSLHCTSSRKASKTLHKVKEQESRCHSIWPRNKAQINCDDMYFPPTHSLQLDHVQCLSKELNHVHDNYTNHMYTNHIYHIPNTKPLTDHI